MKTPVAVWTEPVKTDNRQKPPDVGKWKYYIRGYHYAKKVEVEEALGLTGYRPVHELLKRERKKEQQGVPKQRGRKPAKTLQEYKYENKRLKMEVELLRDFLSLTGKEWRQALSIR